MISFFRLSRAECFIGRWDDSNVTTGSWKQQLEQIMLLFSDDVDSGKFISLSLNALSEFSDPFLFDEGHFVATIELIIEQHSFSTSLDSLYEIASVCEKYLLWLRKKKI